MSNKKTFCCCGSNFQYESCCGPFHDFRIKPLTAEALMRSRFTAYSMKNESYLLKTWDSDMRLKEINFSKENAIWSTLEIITIKKGCEQDKKGIVEFKAYYSLDGEDYVMNEISRFKKTAGTWFYMDGVVKSVSKVGQQVNLGKNALCACGSGKKFKRCCGK